MQWNKHYDLSRKHALLGASQNSWLNYDQDRVRQIYESSKRKELGTELHAFASQAIKHRIKLGRLKKSVNQFVNDAIGFNMESEKVLYYSDVAFGTADAICFRDGVLRIHDLKTGDIPVKKFNQLDIYAALFCLEYDVDPTKIEIVQRLYQANRIKENNPDPYRIADIMDKIVRFSAILIQLQDEEGE